MVTPMQRSCGIVGLLVVVLLSGCSALGAKASPSASASAPVAAQLAPVSSAAFEDYIERPNIAGSFSAMEGTRSSGDTALHFVSEAQRVPCLADKMDKVSLAIQAGYLHDADRNVYLVEFRFASNEQAGALQAIADDMVQCVSKTGGLPLSSMGSVKAGGTDFPVYSTLSGDVYRITILTVRNITALVIVRGESRTPIDAMASEVYESIKRIS